MSIKPDASIAARLSNKVQLAGVHFACVSGKIIEADPGDGELGWNLKPIEVVWDGDATSMRVAVPYSLLITKTSPEAAPRNIVQIQVFIRVDYVLPKDETFTPDEQSHFAAVLGVMHTWPYFRSEVQALTAKMELPPLTLPSIVSGHVERLANVRQLTEAEAKAASGGVASVTAPPPEKSTVASP